MPGLRDSIFGARPVDEEPSAFGRPAAAPTPQEMMTLEASGMSSLGRGWEAGRLGTEANRLAAQWSGLRAQGREQEAAVVEDQLRGLRRRQSLYAPRVGRIEDIPGTDLLDSAGNAGEWLAGQVGQGAASMVDPALAAAGAAAAGRALQAAPNPLVKTAGVGLRAVGAPAAAYGINQEQLRGEFLNNARDDAVLMDRTSPQDLDRTATAYGLGAGLLDTVIPAKAGAQVANIGVRKGAVAGFGRRQLTDMGIEGGTELLQNAGGQQVLGHLNPDRDTSGDIMENVNAFLGGAVGGAPISAAGNLADTSSRAAGATADATKSGVQMAGKLAGQAKDAVTERMPADAMDAAIKGGELAGKGVTKMQELLRDFTSRDPDERALITPQSKDTIKTTADLEADDTQRNTRAQTLAEKYLSGDYPQELKQAAQKYLAGSKAGEAWKELSAAAKDYTSSQRVQQGIKDFFTGLKDKVSDAVVNAEDLATGAKAGYQIGRRENAQIPAMYPKSVREAVMPARDDFSAVLEREVTPYIGQSERVAAWNAPVVSHGLRQWIASGFKGDKTEALHKMFEDPAAAVMTAYDLMKRQGLVKGEESDTRLREVLADLQEQDATVDGRTMPIGQVIQKFMKPVEADKLRQLMGSNDFSEVGRKLVDRVARGAITKADLAEYFGDPDALLAALSAKLDERRTKLGIDKESGASKDAADDVRDMTNVIAPNTESLDDTKWHFYNASSEAPWQAGADRPADVKTGKTTGKYDDHAAVTIGNLSSKGGQVEKVGYVDALLQRNGLQKTQAEDLSLDPESDVSRRHEEVLQQVRDFIEAQKKKGWKPRDGQDEIVSANNDFYVLRERTKKDVSGGIPPETFDVVEPGKKGNRWAESAGKTGGKDTLNEGKIWLRRADGVEFMTSAAKLINWAGDRRADDEGSIGEHKKLANKRKLLLEGLAAMMDSHSVVVDNKGVEHEATALQPVVGFKRVGGDLAEPTWMPYDKLRIPRDLRLEYAGETYGQAVEAQRRAAELEKQRPLDLETARKAGYAVAMQLKAKAPNSPRLQAVAQRLEAASRTIYNKGEGADIARDEIQSLLGRSRKEFILPDTDEQGNVLSKEERDAIAAAREEISELRREGGEPIVLGLYDAYPKAPTKQSVPHPARQVPAAYQETDKDVRERTKRGRGEAPSYELSAVSAPRVIDRDADGKLFADKRAAQEYAAPGDQVRKVAGRWVVKPADDRPVSVTTRRATAKPQETEGMGDQMISRSLEEDWGVSSEKADRGEDEGVRTYDQNAGARLDELRGDGRRDQPAARSEAEKRRTNEVAGQVIELLRKGVPATVAELKSRTPGQRGVVLNQLRAMVESPPIADVVDHPAWGTNKLNTGDKDPAAVFDAFKKRGMEVLARFKAVPTAKKGEIPKSEAPSTKDAAQRENAQTPGGRVVLPVTGPYTAKDQAKSDKATKFVGRRENAQAVRIHNDLGRQGFAATHDSPTRHDGRFNWREYQGSGEGNASFGAGTYLSTADEVHKSYKDQFTAQATQTSEQLDYVRRAQAVETAKVRVANAEKQLKHYPDSDFYKSELATYRGGIEINQRWLDAHPEAKPSSSPTYEVSVDISQDQLLNWDKPLREQNATVRERVLKALSDKRVELPKRLDWDRDGETTWSAYAADSEVTIELQDGGFKVFVDGDFKDIFRGLDEAKAYADYTMATGRGAYAALSAKLGSQAKASDYLQSLGILGHEYASSSGKNDAHPNYVIYDDSKITTNYVHFNAQSAERPTADEAKAPELAKAMLDIKRRLGNDMKVEFKELFGAKNNPISGEWVDGLIRISIHARSPGQIGAHESMHELFSRMMAGGPDATKAAKIMTNAASSQPVLRQLQRLLRDEPAALKQIADGAKHAAEERLAYAFQFWQAGLLKIGPETEGVFTKVANMLRKALGILSEHQKAEALFKAFEEGKMPDADAAARVLAENVEYRERLYKAGAEKLKPLGQRIGRLVNTTAQNLEALDNPAASEIVRMFNRPVGEGGGQSFYEAKDQKFKQFSNKLLNAIDGVEKKDLELAAELLHTNGTTTDPVIRRTMVKVKRVLREMHSYMTEAGVMRFEPDEEGGGQWVPMGKIENYYPRVYDVAKIVAAPDKFVEALMTHNKADLDRIAGQAGATAEEVAEAIANRLTNAGGSDLDETVGSVGFTPMAQQVNKRTLHWISPEVLKEFGEKDLAKVMTAYIAQGVKRAEYVRRFGNDGEVLQGKIEKLSAIELGKEMRKAHGMSDTDFKKWETAYAEALLTKKTSAEALESSSKAVGLDAAKSRAAELKALERTSKAATDVMALEGTLGYNVNPKWRQFQNAAMTYQNLRVLGLSLFSQMIDPLGLMVRGGQLSDAFAAYKRGIKEVVASYKGERTQDEAAKIAEQVGTLDAHGMLAAYGQLHSSVYMAGKFRAINEGLFKYNGMEGFNRGMQIAATQSAINFIKRHVENPTKNSADYLAELNLKPADVKITADGNLDYRDPKIQNAIHRWVNGAVLRPNASQRPAWASDPHWMIFWHMKQFAYTFHDVTIKRALHDVKKYDDASAIAALVAGMVPVMVAADAAKSLLLTGSEPTWMKAGLGSEISHGVNRAGLLGQYQPIADSALGSHGLLGVAGPSVEQVGSLFVNTPGDSVINALPGASVIHTARSN